MFTAEQLPHDEIQLRQEKCRHWLQTLAPHTSGMLIFSRTHIYYLTGTRANGILWLPRHGDPVLMVRKAPERCRLESPIKHIVPFKSYSHIPELCAACDVPLQGVIGAEMRALPWSLAKMLEERLSDFSFEDTSAIFDRARYEKTPYELTRLRHSAKQHTMAMQELIPRALHASVSEQKIAHTVWQVFYALGHGGMLRQDRYNSDLFLGTIASGANTLYPSPFRSPLGNMGEHPAMPYMGYAGSVWKKGQCLVIDTGFMFEGYHSHAAATYFAGTKEEIPQEMRSAYAFCVDVLQKLSQNLQEHTSLSSLWQKAYALAKQAGYEQTFMGMGQQHTPTLGSGLGLSMEEWPSICAKKHAEEDVCLAQSVFTLASFVALPTLQSMVGIKAVFEVQKEGSLCLTPYAQEIICVES